MSSRASTRGPFRVATEHDVGATMRDGTVLRSEVYRPETGGRAPVLLSRTPYGKDSEAAIELGRKLSERGFVVVVQDVRGRYSSDGEFRPGFFSPDHSDSVDGYDAVEWAAALPWSDGKVGVFGNSYVGWTQWELAHMRPPHLVAMMPQGIAANLLDRELGGTLRLGRVLWWTANTLAPDLRRRAGAPGPTTTEEAERIWTERDRVKWLWYLPLAEIPDDAIFGVGERFRGWLKDHAVDHFGFEGKHREIEVPALTVTGWYDQQIGAIKHFTGMARNGRTERARSGQRLIIGPWTHTNVDWASKVGDVDFGPEATRDYYDVAEGWFAHWLKGEPTGVDEWPPIQLFVMGANRWRGESEWPLARTTYTKLYLRDGGRLSEEPPADESADRYVYDPRDPVMSLYTAGGQQEPHDLRQLDGRADVLVYATPPLEQPLEVTGPVEVRLWAASSALDTDFVARLVDVWPDGFAQELCHGIVRARYRESYTEPSLLRPGQVYEYTIRVNPTSNLFGRGHRVRLDITSSDFPNFDRNHNTGADDYADATLTTAEQTVFHDRLRPSAVVLPIIP